MFTRKMIWDVGGLPPLTGAKFIDQTVEQGLTFDPEVVLNEKSNPSHATNRAYMNCTPPQVMCIIHEPLLLQSAVAS